MNRRGFLSGLLATPLLAKLSPEAKAAHTNPMMNRAVAELAAAKQPRLVEETRDHWKKIRFAIDHLDFTRNVRNFERHRSTEIVRRDPEPSDDFVLYDMNLMEERISVELIWETAWLPYMEMNPGPCRLDIDTEIVHAICTEVRTVASMGEHPFYRLEFRRIA